MAQILSTTLLGALSAAGYGTRTVRPYFRAFSAHSPLATGANTTSTGTVTYILTISQTGIIPYEYWYDERRLRSQPTPPLLNVSTTL
eukprot:scaffold177546_cov43-Prasinocladus_malaysianus.AAC.1